MVTILHELRYRGAPAIARLASAEIVVCGAGALGSLLVDNLVRHGACRLTVIDMDRVEGHNIGTQIYDQSEIGAFKAEQLRARCFRTSGIEIEAITRQLNERNVARLLRGDLVVDAFDNSASRRLVTEHCRQQGIACLHMGVNTDYGELRWNEHYRVPGDVGDGACDYPLARNLILFVVALGSEAVLRYLLEGRKQGFCFTLRDLAIADEDRKKETQF